MSVGVWIECDGCAREVTFVCGGRQPAAAPARVRLRDEGWHVTRGFGAARDICPTCWAKGLR